MPGLEAIIGLIVATAILVAIPGPNVALIVANSLRHGFAPGVKTVFGTTCGIAVQLMFAVTGLSALIAFAAGVMLWIKWLGIAYLIYLGIKAWNEKAESLEHFEPVPRTTSSLFWQGFGMAIVNPKTLLFNVAFIPQFVSGSHVTSQMVVLSLIYLTVLFTGDSLWAACAGSACGFIRRFGSLHNKLTGGFFISAALALALARTPRN